jgi:hypothetical protein
VRIQQAAVFLDPASPSLTALRIAASSFCPSSPGLATDGGDSPSTTVDDLINSIPAASF